MPTHTVIHLVKESSVKLTWVRVVVVDPLGPSLGPGEVSGHRSGASSCCCSQGTASVVRCLRDALPGWNHGGYGCGRRPPALREFSSRPQAGGAGRRVDAASQPLAGPDLREYRKINSEKTP